MRCLVTGVAGFVGSHLAERLIALGHEVVGIDALTPYYEPALKRQNLLALRDHQRFSMIDDDLCELELEPVVEGIDQVFHLAGQPGVRGSWGEQFDEYARHNINATQRLLEALRERPPSRIVYASSSSVYGDTPLPMREDALPQPLSPYGVTKLAGEHLMRAYWKSYGLPAISLRFFTVYGPRQRPDMAFNRFIRAISQGKPIQLYGDGSQTRDFTYVEDVVEALLKAATVEAAAAVGAVINVGGGSSVPVNDVLTQLGQLIGRPVRVARRESQRGDAPHTTAATERARELLEWSPSVSLAEGLRRQVEWQLGAAASRNASARSSGGSRRTPRLLLYGHDTYGLGHLRRNLTLARGLTHEFPDLSVLLITGSPAVQYFDLPPNVDYVKLPAVIKVADEDYRAKTLSLQPDEITAMRAALARESMRGFAPDVVLVDHAPIGMKGELLPALEELRAANPRARVALGLRDIVDEPDRVRANWTDRDIYDALNRLYDAILVYGIPQTLDAVSAYEMPPSVAAKTRYCGYLRRERSVANIEAIHARFCPNGERLALVTAGGGGDGMSLFSTYLEGLIGAEAPHDTVSVIVTGPFMPPGNRDALAAMAKQSDRVHVLEFADDMLGLMQAADLVVCMGGYNTLCEVLSVGARALVVPRVEPRREQLMRARAFDALGLVKSLSPVSLTSSVLMRHVAEMLDESAGPASNDFRMALAEFTAAGALDGMNMTARAIGDLLRQAIDG
ncbi:MAG TPA: NAD-dependent epimerase/dehydratase family protein [Ktedonobacterales bacterium]